MKVQVNDVFFEYFNEVSIATTIDTVASTFSITGKYDPTNDTHKILFKPLTLPKVRFYDEKRENKPNKGLLATGVILNCSFNSHDDPDLVTLSGYSLPGVLEDCNIPFNSYKRLDGSNVEIVALQSVGLTLKQIIDKMIKPFGLNFIVYDSVAADCAQIVPKSIARPEETIKSYICKIANQKNVIISHDIYGNLIAFRPKVTSDPKYRLTKQNTLSLELEIDGQGLHSHITCVRQPEKGDGTTDPFTNGSQGASFDGSATTPDHVLKVSSADTVINPIVKAFRPYVDVLSAGTFYDTKRAALNRRAAELKTIKVKFTINQWLPVSIGDVLTVIDDEIFINTEQNMVLESTTITETPAGRTLSGSLVLPETYTNEEPKDIFREYFKI